MKLWSRLTHGMDLPRLMQAMAAVHVGSYTRARTLLEDGAAALPSDPDISDALARVLAAAPDPAVRDPGRSLRIVGTLVRNQQGNPLEVGIPWPWLWLRPGNISKLPRISRRSSGSWKPLTKTCWGVPCART